jgi:tRNASer (uridine44-2'-O)-methyltransferase
MTKASSSSAATAARPPCDARLLLGSADATAGPSSAAALAPLPRSLSGLPQQREEDEWLPLAECTAYAPLDAWLEVMVSLVHHPERNSSTILRADVLADEDADDDAAGPSSSADWRRFKRVHRRLLPRRSMDWPMEQECSFYTQEPSTQDALVVYTQYRSRTSRTALGEARGTAPSSTQPDDGEQPAELPESADEVPYYHPAVRALSFQFDASSADALSTPPRFGALRVFYIGFPTTPSPLPADDRLARTALMLLKVQHMHSWGTAHDYVKRVHHDVLVPRVLYLDTYLALKERHTARLIATWAETTNPAKHVFEDLGIAAWLMCLWKGMYESTAASDDRPWSTWGRPEGGFVDLGCGNGLLVHILNAEASRLRRGALPKLTSSRAGLCWLRHGSARAQVLGGLPRCSWRCRPAHRVHRRR